MVPAAAHWSMYGGRSRALFCWLTLLWAQGKDLDYSLLQQAFAYAESVSTKVTVNSEAIQAAENSGGGGGRRTAGRGGSKRAHGTKLARGGARRPPARPSRSAGSSGTRKGRCVERWPWRCGERDACVRRRRGGGHGAYAKAAAALGARAGTKTRRKGKASRRPRGGRTGSKSARRPQSGGSDGNGESSAKQQWMQEMIRNFETGEGVAVRRWARHPNGGGACITWFRCLPTATSPRVRAKRELSQVLRRVHFERQAVVVFVVGTAKMHIKNNAAKPKAAFSLGPSQAREDNARGLGVTTKHCIQRNTTARRAHNTAGVSHPNCTTISEQSLDAELGAAPVPPLGVVADGVVRTQADPLRDGAVLLGLLGQRTLGAERLVGRHCDSCNATTHSVSAYQHATRRYNAVPTQTGTAQSCQCAQTHGTHTHSNSTTTRTHTQPEPRATQFTQHRTQHITQPLMQSLSQQQPSQLLSSPLGLCGRCADVFQSRALWRASCGHQNLVFNFVDHRQSSSLQAKCCFDVVLFLASVPSAPARGAAAMAAPCPPGRY